MRCKDELKNKNSNFSIQYVNKNLNVNCRITANSTSDSIAECNGDDLITVGCSISNTEIFFYFNVEYIINKNNILAVSSTFSEDTSSRIQPVLRNKIKSKGSPFKTFSMLNQLYYYFKLITKINIITVLKNDK